MTAWMVVGGILLVLFLLGRLRLGGRAEYSQAGVEVFLRIGPFRVQIVPGKEKKKKEQGKEKKKKKKKREKKDAEEKKKGPGPVKLAKAFLPLITDTLGRLRKKIRIDELQLDYLAAGEDAAATALTYGRANMAVGALLPLLDRAFEIRKRRVRTGVDFTRQEAAVYVLAAFSITVGQLLAIVLRLGIRGVKTYLALQNNQT